MDFKIDAEHEINLFRYFTRNFLKDPLSSSQTYLGVEHCKAEQCKVEHCTAIFCCWT